MRWYRLLETKRNVTLLYVSRILGWTEKTMNDQILIPQTRYVDLVLGGHSHTFFETLRTHKDLDNNTVITIRTVKAVSSSER